MDGPLTHTSTLRKRLQYMDKFGLSKRNLVFSNYKEQTIYKEINDRTALPRCIIIACHNLRVVIYCIPVSEDIRNGSISALRRS